MARTRAKTASGQPLDNSDIRPGEKITLRGGVSEDGKPAELVRERDGTIISIEEGYFDADGDDMLDTDVMRSMARKRKCDIGKVEYHACRECGKVYTRPCDLTKHEKTHSRPWKCSQSDCKYYELGWPTEKERDRHVNDKHSSAPALYRCLYKPCAYTSKRESNCKQHMEKAHGWDYVRSKSRKGTKLIATRSPGAELMPTPMSERLATPSSINNLSPVASSYDSFSPIGSINSGFESTRGSSGSHQPSNGFASPASNGPAFDFNDYSKDSYTYNGYISPEMSEGRRFSDNINITPPTDNVMVNTTTAFEDNFNFGNLNYVNDMVDIFPQYQIPPHQQPTPASDYNFDFNSMDKPHQSELSPGGHGDSTLFGSDNQGFNMDSQGFADFVAQAKPGQQASDFALFDDSTSAAHAATATMFPELGDMSMAGLDQGEMSTNLDGGDVQMGMFGDMSEEEMDRYLYGDGSPASSGGSSVF